MNDRTLQVLILEKNTADANLIVRELRRHYDASCTRVENEQMYRSALDTHPDIILANSSSPGLNVPRALAILNDSDLDIPFIVIASQEAGEIALKQGASDYVPKEHLHRLAGAVSNALQQRRVHSATSHDKEMQRQLQERAIAAFTQGITIADAKHPDHPIIFVNPGFERLTGYRPEEVIGKNCRLLHGPRTDASTVAQVDQAMQEGQPVTTEILNYRKDGSTFWNGLTISPIHDKAGKLTHFVGVQTDISERKRLEGQCRQAQKMEAVGRLAGGIAHDFNNLLTVILGCSDLVLSALSSEAPFREHLQQIKQAGERGATLTRQLLAFSRKQLLEPRLLYLNDIVADMSKMLRRLIGEDIDYITNLDSTLGLVKADLGQIEQVILNLVVNARDAMPKGGRVTIETRNVELDARFARERPEVQPGSYILMTIRDTGCGMSPDVLAHMYEPFFTTKESGKGTGLGLATVYGVVKQSNGYIYAESQPGRGATFYVYLPRVRSTEINEPQLTTPQVFPQGKETILIVEDDDTVRRLNRYVLHGKGYNVLEASDGEAAAKICAEYKNPIHLVITDVIMPKMSCRELVERIVVMRPSAKILYVSGYSADVIAGQGIAENDICVLQKPFQPVSLLRKVREMLKGSEAAAKK